MRLRNLFAAVIFIAVAVATAHAQQAVGFVESYNTVSEAGIIPQLNVYVHGPIKGKLGWSLWTLTTEAWSEGYAGLTFAPVKGIEVSGSLGLESDDNPLRVGSSIWIGKERWSLLSIHENGGSGYWYMYLGIFQATRTVAIGVNSIRFFGTGPYIEKKFGKIALSSSYAIGDNKGIVGVRFNF